MPACPDSTITCKESILTSLMNSPSGDQPKRSISPEGSITSKHRTICENIYEQEQSFTTAPGSLGPSIEPIGYRVPSPETTGCAPSPSSHDDERMVTTPLALAKEEWMCYDPGPLFHFLLFFTILFDTFGHSFPTHSLTRRSDHHQIT